MNANNRLGEVLRDGALVGLRYERRLSHPPVPNRASGASSPQRA